MYPIDGSLYTPKLYLPTMQIKYTKGRVSKLSLIERNLVRRASKQVYVPAHGIRVGDLR